MGVCVREIIRIRTLCDLTGTRCDTVSDQGLAVIVLATEGDRIGKGSNSY